METVRRAAVLEVPFSEKDEAKALGAWWDPELKKWFVPQGRDLTLFERWMPEAVSRKKGGRTGEPSPASK